MLGELIPVGQKIWVLYAIASHRDGAMMTCVPSGHVIEQHMYSYHGASYFNFGFVFYGLDFIDDGPRTIRQTFNDYTVHPIIYVERMLNQYYA